MRTELEKLIQALKDDATAESFPKILLKAYKLLDLSDEKVAKRFGASRPTVGRWRNGSNAPRAATLRSVYDWILVEAEARLARVERYERQERELEDDNLETSSSSHRMPVMAAKSDQ